MADASQLDVMEHEKRREEALGESAPRVPVKAPEGLISAVGHASAANAADDGQSQEKFHNPSLWQSAKQGWKGARTGSIQALPAVVVNNSSNLIGAAHVATEMMMFKASSKDGRLVNDPSNPISWIRDPIKNVFLDTFKRSKGGHGNYGELLKGNPFKNIYQRITDTEAATARVVNSAANKNLPRNAVKFSNPWQTRSTLTGLVVWSLSALIPEKKESDDEIERMTIKSRVSPVSYVAERFKQAVWLPDWGHHKRQMLGLGYMIIGMCSTIGAWRGRFEDKATGIQKYTFNKSYLITSLLSFGASMPLLFASDEQRGYSGYGAIMMGRIPFLFGSIKQKYKDNDPGRQWYAASMASFQAENFAQALIGGAEKKPDGTIVDHSEIREQAAEKVKQIRQSSAGADFADDLPAAPASLTEQAASSPAIPGAVVSAVHEPEKAMPERVAAHAMQQQEAQQATA